MTDPLSLQAVYDALVCSSPLLFPGLSLIAPALDANNKPLLYKYVAPSQLNLVSGVSLAYVDHCFFAIPTPPPMPPTPEEPPVLLAVGSVADLVRHFKAVEQLGEAASEAAINLRRARFAPLDVMDGVDADDQFDDSIRRADVRSRTTSKKRRHARLLKKRIAEKRAAANAKAAMST
jgi:hypothetical protein